MNKFLTGIKKLFADQKNVYFFQKKGQVIQFRNCVLENRIDFLSNLLNRQDLWNSLKRNSLRRVVNPYMYLF